MTGVGDLVVALLPGRPHTDAAVGSWSPLEQVLHAEPPPDLHVVHGPIDLAEGAPAVDELLTLLPRARLLLADVGEGDAGVLYRLGAARALSVPTQLFAASSARLPLDVLATPTTFYDSRAGVDSVARVLRRALRDPAGLVPGSVSPADDRVFISYSHADRPYLERLLVHLRPIERQGRISLWSDTLLQGGDQWRSEIAAALHRSRIAVLLVSPDLLDSEFVLTHELPTLLSRAQDQGVIILPVVLRPCRFSRDVRLAQFQAVNDPATPLSGMDDHARDAVYDRIAQIIEQAVDLRA